MLGALILGAVRLPVAAALLVVAFFAIFHGHAHGPRCRPARARSCTASAFVIVTGLLHAAGIGIGVIQRWSAGRVALRGAGSVVMAGGLFFLLSALA